MMAPMSSPPHMADTQFWSGRTVLVGGGCGFWGSYVVAQLAAAGARVAVIDNLESGRLDRVPPAHGVELIEGDLRDAGTCARAVQGRDCVINLAARASGMEYSRAHHGEMLVQNLLCGLPLLEAARTAGVERYAIMSSSCVYPDDAPIPTPELDVFTGRPERVNEGYGWAKRIQELAGTYYARESGMKVTIVRPVNLYGGNYRWESSEKAHVIPLLVKRVLDGEDPVVVWGSGDQRRYFMHGSDAAAMLLRLIERGAGPEPVNIGFDDDTRIKDLVELICDVSGSRPRIVFDTSKPEGQFRKCVEPTRLLELTGGMRPTISLRDGIAEMIEWHARSFHS